MFYFASTSESESESASEASLESEELPFVFILQLFLTLGMAVPSSSSSSSSGIVASVSSSDSKMASTRVELEKFNGDNDFYLWSLKMRAILIQQGLDSALDDGENPTAKKEKAEVLREVSKERTAAGLWAKLEEMFMKKSLAKRLYMKRRLYTFSMKDGVAMKDHVDEFNKLILDLENVNIILEDEDRALILLSSLPESYEHFIDTLLYGRQILSLKDVKDALESKDLKKRSEKEGHYIKDCFEKKKLEELQKKSNEKAAVASEDEGDYDEADVLVAAERHPTGHKIEIQFGEKRNQADLRLHSLRLLGAFTSAIFRWSKIKRLRSDNGLEYCSKEFEDFCKSKGIARHRTVTYTPQQNGLAERMNRTIIERVRCMLLNANLSKGFWAETVTTIAYLINRSPSSTLGFKTPQELWSGKPPDLSNLRIFGCPAYAHIKQGKLEPRAVKGYFLGYPEGIKGFKIWTLNGKPSRILITRDVTFDEEQMLQSKVEIEIEATEIEEEESAGQKVEHSDSCKTSEQPSDQSKERKNPSELETYQLARDRERRAIKMPKKHSTADLISYALTVADEVNGGEPLSYKEAMCCSDKLKWYAAMQDEIISLKKNNTWILVNKPLNKKLVGSKWIFKLKAGASENEPPRHKAILVAKGFTQRERVDFNEVFSPVVKYSSIRLLLGLSTYHDLDLEQMDVKTAFLHGSLDEEIFMAQAEGLIEKGSEDNVCLLKKSLYGLKQSPRQWYLKFDEFMISHGYCRSKFDNCVYYKLLSSGGGIYLLLYVDDMLIACNQKEEIKKLKVELSTEFEMKDLGAATKILGMQIIRDRESKVLYLSQADYVKRVLTRFNMEDSKPVSTPLSAHFQLSKSLEPTTDDDFNYMREIPYSSAVGSIMYAMVCTRPDMAHAVGVISRFIGNPGKDHWNAVKWVLRYLRGTAVTAIMFGKISGASPEVAGFVDSDYAADKDRRRSITCFVFTICGGAISWKSFLQSVVALSTTEAEYIALTEVVKEAIWLRGLVSELGFKQEVVIVGCDSLSDIQLSKNPKYHERTKHIDVRMHFIRDEISKGVVNVAKVPSEVNPADMLTKPLPSVSEGRGINRLELRWRFVKPKLVIICYELAEVAAVDVGSFVELNHSSSVAENVGGIPVYLSAIQEWMIKFGYSFVTISVRTDISWYRLGRPSKQYAAWYKPVLKTVRLAIALITMLNNQSRASRLSFADTPHQVFGEEKVVLKKEINSNLRASKNKVMQATTTRLIKRIWEEFYSNYLPEDTKEAYIHEVKVDEELDEEHGENSEEYPEDIKVEQMQVDENMEKFCFSAKSVKPPCSSKATKWDGELIRKTCFGESLYKRAIVCGNVVNIGGCVLVETADSDHLPSIYFVEFMFEKSDSRKMVHGRHMLRGSETFLGNTADANESNACKDKIVRERAEDQRIDQFPLEYYCKSLYWPERGAFFKLPKDTMGLGTGVCHSCKIEETEREKDVFKLLGIEVPETSTKACPESTKVKVRRFFRPEDISEEKAYYSDIREVYYSKLVFTVPVTGVEGKCDIRKKHDLAPSDSPTIFEHIFFCEHLYDPDKGTIKPLPPHIKTSVLKERVSDDTAYRKINGKCKEEKHDGAVDKQTDAVNKNRFATLDIFAGCGGLSHGLQQAGVSITNWAIEYEQPARETFKVNHPEALVFINNCNVILRAIMSACGDADDCISTPEAAELAAELDEETIKNLPRPGQVDFISGGPPCQGFSGMNRFNQGSWSKVQCEMILASLSSADYFRPRFFLLENVRNFTSFNKGQTFRLTMASLLQMGYQVRFGVLQAGAYGMSQSRKRAFIWEASPEETLPEWPEPPELKIPIMLLFEAPQMYKSEPVSWFQKKIRADMLVLNDHISKAMSELNLIRCQKIPKQPGSDWRVLPSEKVRLSNGQVVDLIPWCLPITAEKHNQWKGLFGRLDWEGNFPTSVTDPHPMGMVGTCFHPDQDRIITVRECARSQGFSDSYKFVGDIQHKHRQIGNAVPPPLAFAPGRKLKEAVEMKASTSQRYSCVL
ncbi:DNA (cytosine-5)-methyltransferase 1B [Citrus sinensis]|nr:DNA (cytosine-5)-methyltransferase 1B [Citrus sinensis]